MFFPLNGCWPETHPPMQWGEFSCPFPTLVDVKRLMAPEQPMGNMGNCKWFQNPTLPFSQVDICFVSPPREFSEHVRSSTRWCSCSRCPQRPLAAGSGKFREREWHAGVVLMQPPMWRTQCRGCRGPQTRWNPDGGNDGNGCEWRLSGLSGGIK